MWRGLGRRNSSHFLKSNPENKFGRENKTVVDDDSGAEVQAVEPSINMTRFLCISLTGNCGPVMLLLLFRSDGA